jgi:adenosylcobinamide kinase/adenosylcobinamide-phosphate guanylyltransferase
VRTLVLGGIRSGKSRWAEAALAGESRVRYVATGPDPGADAAWAARVAAHRGRRPSGWITVETGDVAAQLRGDPETPALVDDLGGWITAALDRGGWREGSVGAGIDDLASAVAEFTGPLVLVSPEVGLSVVPATAAGRRFADELGILNQRIADCCERVVLVVAGQPVRIKPVT